MRAADILPDEQSHAIFNGVSVRKGTVAAFVANARVLADTNASAGQRQQAEQDILADLPALRSLGLFEVFQLRDAAVNAWIEAH
ncbi:hypothetical protein [Rhodoferax sp.]|uniref:hypothetical protein n=1 Tax=Rhodoferax sp. TaxID=50421 RepID=UPI00374D03BA